MSPFRGLGFGEKGNRWESCTNSSLYLGSRSRYITGKTFPGKMADVMIYEPGDLPAVVQEQLFQPTSNWEYMPGDKI